VRRSAGFAIVAVAALMAAAACTPQESRGRATLKPGEMPTASSTASQAHPPETSSGLQARFHVYGNRIVDSTGAPFIARGLEVYDVSRSTWQQDLVRDAQVGNLSPAEFQAAAEFWHANLIRIQLAEDNLQPGAPPGYLNEIDKLVGYANSNGMAVILSDQTEETSNSPAPTQESIAFWDQVASHFANNPSVMFDLFNEWRVPVRDVGGESGAWTLWQQGGVDPVTGRAYVGMQALVDAVRRTGATNLILAQGIDSGEVLDQVGFHQLSGGNIAYAVHPYFNAQELGDPTKIWDARFGVVSQTLPVIADEWGEYQSPKGECFAGAPAMVPELFSYLRAHDIGLVGWALFPGLLIRGWSWTTPTSFDQPSYTCGVGIPFPNLSPTAQGAGRDLLDYFASQAGG
jgi:endoglucanase